MGNHWVNNAINKETKSQGREAIRVAVFQTPPEKDTE